MTTPADTKQLMEVKAFVEKVESETIYTLEKELAESRDRLVFLVDHAHLNPVDIRNNADVFLWHARMPQVVDEHRQIIAEKRVQYEDALKVHVTLRSVKLLLYQSSLLIIIE